MQTGLKMKRMLKSGWLKWRGAEDDTCFSADAVNNDVKSTIGYVTSSVAPASISIFNDCVVSLQKSF